MANVSDIIESFILSSLQDCDDIHLSRNELAEFFNCAPSQINYVLSTRFNLNRGYIIQSQRGGGGFIKLVKLKDFDDNYLYKIISENLKAQTSFKDASFLLQDLVGKEFLKQDEANLITFAISDKALASPFKIQDSLRANILKNILINIKRERSNEDE